jgi:small subunit ribosomal protein S16
MPCEQDGAQAPRRVDEDVLKLRLTRMGAKGRPHYRIVVQEARSKRDGRFVENVGHYNPLTEPSTIVVNEERVRYWLSVGAQPTDSVVSLLKRAGVETGTKGAAPAATATTATTEA